MSKEVLLIFQETWSLHVFINQRRRNCNIFAVTVKAKIIDKAHSLPNPISPNKKLIYLTFWLFGFMIPLVISIKNILDTNVHSIKDLDEYLTVHLGK